MSQIVHSVTLSLPFPLLLSPFCLLPAAEGKPKGNDHPQGLLSSRKTKVARAKNAFSPAVPSPMAGPWAGIRDIRMSATECLLNAEGKHPCTASLSPSAASGEFVTLSDVQKEDFWGRAGAVWGLLSGQGPSERSQHFMGKQPWPTLAFMGEEECESKIKFTQLCGWPPLLCRISLCTLMSAMTLRKSPLLVWQQTCKSECLRS